MEMLLIKISVGILLAGLCFLTMRVMTIRAKLKKHVLTFPFLTAQMDEEITKMLDKKFRQHDCDHTRVTFHDGPNRHCHYGTDLLELIIRCTSCNKEWPTYNGPTIQEESKDVQRALIMDPKVGGVFKEHVDRDIFSKNEIQAFVTLGMMNQPEETS